MELLSWGISRFCWNMELLFCSLFVSSFVVSRSTLLSSSASWNLQFQDTFARDSIAIRFERRTCNVSPPPASRISRSWAPLCNSLLTLTFLFWKASFPFLCEVWLLWVAGIETETRQKCKNVRWIWGVITSNASLRECILILSLSLLSSLLRFLSRALMHVFRRRVFPLEPPPLDALPEKKWVDLESSS